ncbi:MAG: ribose-5-phosphate isomerase [Arachnia sp.]
MRIHIATDHAAFELKNFLVEKLQSAGHEVVDHGAATYQALDDYPTYVIPCAEAVVADGTLGVVLGGSGNGEQISANKVTGVRAALAYNAELARLAREHNNANIVSLGGRMQPQEVAWEIVDTFVNTPFSGDARHQRRIDAIAAYEAGE